MATVTITLLVDTDNIGTTNEPTYKYCSLSQTGGVEGDVLVNDPADPDNPEKDTSRVSDADVITWQGAPKNKNSATQVNITSIVRTSGSSVLGMPVPGSPGPHGQTVTATVVNAGAGNNETYTINFNTNGTSYDLDPKIMVHSHETNKDQ